MKGSELEAELIDEVVARIRERLPSDQVYGCEAFARHYFRWVPPEDLADRDAIDLYGAVVAHWNLAQHRAPGEAKLHVYNPDFEQHGWQSSNTVVELVTEDMPFLVDSVTMEVARQGYGTQLVIHPVIEVTRDSRGSLVGVVANGDGAGSAQAESVMHIELDREPDPERRAQLTRHIERVLREVRAAVEDWYAMRTIAETLGEMLAADHVPASDGEAQ